MNAPWSSTEDQLVNEIGALRKDVDQRDKCISKLESRNAELDELSSTWIQDGLKKDNTIREMKNRAAAHDKAVRELLEAVDDMFRRYTIDKCHDRVLSAYAAVGKFHEEQTPLAALRGSGSKLPDNTTSEKIVAKMRDNDWGESDA